MGVRGAVLLAKADGVRLAVFNALAAGNALLLIDAGNVVGADGVLGAEHLGDTQSIAGAAAAVADSGGLFKAGSLVNLMDKTVILGAAENLVCLLLGDETMCAGLAVVYGVIVEVHAHILFEVTAALSHQTAGAAAGAGTDGDGGRVLNEGGDLVIGRGLGVVLDGAHDGHDTHHEHTELAGVECRGDHLGTAAGVLLKAVADVRVTLALLFVGEYTLDDAGNPDGVIVAVAGADLAGADDARYNELVYLLLNECLALVAALCDVLDGTVCLKTHMHHDAAHIVVNYRGKYAIFRILVGYAGVGKALKADLSCQLENIRSVCHKTTSYVMKICT